MMPNMPETSCDSRLRWRCRRGMLELDLILNGFMERGYDGLSAERKVLLDQLLDYPDQLLYELLLGHMVSSDREIADLVSHIRHTFNA